MGLLKFDIGDTVTFYHGNIGRMFKGVIIRYMESFINKNQFEVGNLKPKGTSVKSMYVPSFNMNLTRMVLTEKALWK